MANLVPHTRTKREKRHHGWIGGLFRPAITSVLTVGLFICSTYLALIGKLEIEVYFNSWKDIVLMLLGFYFAQRTEQKRKEDVNNP